MAKKKRGKKSGAGPNQGSGSGQTWDTDSAAYDGLKAMPKQDGIGSGMGDGSGHGAGGENETRSGGSSGTNNPTAQWKEYKKAGNPLASNNLMTPGDTAAKVSVGKGQSKSKASPASSAQVTFTKSKGGKPKDKPLGPPPPPKGK